MNYTRRIVVLLTKNKHILIVSKALSIVRNHISINLNLKSAHVVAIVLASLKFTITTNHILKHSKHREKSCMISNLR